MDTFEYVAGSLQQQLKYRHEPQRSPAMKEAQRVVIETEKREGCLRIDLNRDERRPD